MSTAGREPHDGPIPYEPPRSRPGAPWSERPRWSEAEPALRLGGAFVLVHGLLGIGAILAERTQAYATPGGPPLHLRDIVSVVVDLALGYFLWERLRGMRLWAVLRALGAIAIAIAVSGDGHGWLDISAACAFAAALSAAVIGTPGRLRLALGSLAFAAYALPTAAAVAFVWTQAAR